MPKTSSHGKRGKRRTTGERRRREPMPDAVDRALLRAGLLRAVPVLGPDATDDIAPIVIPGEPVSATIIRERR